MLLKQAKNDNSVMNNLFFYLNYLNVISDVVSLGFFSNVALEASNGLVGI